MAYQGVYFALVLGIAVGTAVYYYFCNDEKQQKSRQHTYSPPCRPPCRTPPRPSTPSEEINLCIFCLNEITLHPRPRALKCGHVFHNKCISVWLNNNKSCPLCRTGTSQLG